MVMEESQGAGAGRTGGGLDLSWWAASGFALGIAALLALVTIAAATPVDAVVARSGEFGPIGRDFFGGDFGLRFAGIAAFVIAAGALFAQSARHSRQLAAAEQKRNPRSRE